MDDKNAGYSDDKELKKMRFLFSLGRELDEVDMSVDELMTILSGDGRPVTKVDPTVRRFSEVDEILKDDEEVRELPKHGEDKVDERSSTVAQPKKAGGSISHVNRMIHNHLRRTALANDLTELEKDRIEMIFFEAMNKDGIMNPAVKMCDLMTYRMGKNIDLKLVYSLRTCYNRVKKDKGVDITKEQVRYIKKQRDAKKM